MRITKKRIGDIVTFKRGYDLPAHQRVDGDYPVYSSSGLTGYHNEYKAKGQGVVTGRYGTLGKMYYVNGKYWPHNTALYATDFHGNYPKYVYYLMQSLSEIKRPDKSTVPGVNRNDLHELVVPFIERDFQKGPADLLYSLDTKIALNQQINAELEAMARRLYEYWFVQFDFPYDFERGQPDPQGRPYKSSGGEMVYSEVLKREVPKGWEVKELGEVAKTGSGGTPLKSKPEYFQAGEIPWINSGELNSPFLVRAEKFISQLGLKKSSAKLFPSGTILLAMYGATAGKVSLIDFEATTNQAICAIIPERDLLCNYLRFSLASLYDYLVNLSSGSARDNLSQEKIRNLDLLIPNSDLLDNFEATVSGFNSYIFKNIRESQHLASLRDWLLPMLMNGQVVVGEAAEMVEEAQGGGESPSTS